MTTARVEIPKKLIPVGMGDLPKTEEYSHLATYKPFANRPTMTERADHIGIAEGTLYRWKREGVDIYNDDQVRKRIASSRRWIPGLSDAFRVRLSGT